MGRRTLNVRIGKDDAYVEYWRGKAKACDLCHHYHSTYAVLVWDIYRLILCSFCLLRYTAGRVGKGRKE